MSSANKKSIVGSRKKNRHTHNTQMARYNETKMKSRLLSNDFCACSLFLLTLLEVLGKTHMSVHDNNHGKEMKFHYFEGIMKFDGI